LDKTGIKEMTRIFFLWFTIGLILPTFSFADNFSDTIKMSEIELVTLARKNYDGTVKNYCVNFWSPPDKIDLLSKFATVSEHCKCMQDEMNYSMTDDLAIRLLKLQMQADILEEKYLSVDLVKATANEWGSKYGVAHKTCTERFIRRRESTR
jgi:hypothetical protein